MIARVGGAELSNVGTPLMITRHNTSRLTALVSMSALLALLPIVAAAQVLNGPQTATEQMPEPVETPLSDNYIWDKHVAVAEPTPAGEAATLKGSGDIPPSKPPVEDA